MATDAQVLFKINADTSGATRNLSGLQSTGQRVDNTFNKSVLFSGAIAGVVATATSKITGLFSGLTSTIMKSADSATKFEQTLKFAGLKDDKIKKIAESVREFSRKSVFAVEDLLNTTALLSANGVKDADVMVKALGGLTAAAGGTRESFSNIALAYTRVQASGKLMTMEWNMITDAIPGASGLLQKALKDAGAYTGDFRKAMANGAISAKDFSKAIKTLGLQDIAQEAATSTKTFEGIFASMRSTVVTFGKNILKAIGEENVKAALREVQKALKETLNAIIEGINILKKYEKQLKTAAIAIGVFAGALQMTRVVKGLMDVSKAIKHVVTGLKLAREAGVLLKVVNLELLATNPFGWIGLAIAAVVALVALIILNWDTVKKVTLDVTKAVAKFFVDAAKVIGEWFGGIGEAIGGAFDTVVNTVKGVVDTIVGFFAGIVGAIVGVVSPIIGFIVGIFSALIQGILIILGPLIEFWKGMFNILVVIVQGAINIIVGIFRILIALIQIALQPFIWLFQTLIAGVVTIFQGFVETMKTIFNVMMEVIKVIVSPIVDFFKVIGAGIAFAWNVAATQIGNVIKVMGTVINNVFTTIKNFVKPIIDWFVSAWTKAVKGIQGVFKSMSKVVKGIFDGIVNAIKGMMNGIIGGLNWVIGGINAIPGHDKVPKIPKLAKGGIINGPTHALVGEAGPEAVVPLTPKGIAKFAKGLGITNTNTNSENNYTFNITANEVDEKAIESLLRRKAMAQGW